MSNQIHPVEREPFDPLKVKRTSFGAQFNALFRKSATDQGRKYLANCCQCVMPLLVMILLLLIQALVTSAVQAANPYGKTTPEIAHPSAEPPLFFVTNEEYLSGLGDCYKGGSASISPRAVPANFWLVDDVAGGAPASFLTALKTGKNDRKAFTKVDYLMGRARPTDLEYDGLLLVESAVNPAQGSSITTCDNIYLQGVNFTLVPENIASLEERIFRSWTEERRDIGGFEIKSLSATAGVKASLLYNDTITQGKDLRALIGIVSDAFVHWASGGGSTPANSTSPAEYKGGKSFPIPETVNDFDLVSLIGPSLYIFLLQFMLPVITSSIVYEKENKILSLTTMMGLRRSVYFAVTYIFGYLLYFLSAMALLILGNAFRFNFFTRNTGFGLFLLFFLWGHVLVAFALFMSVFFAKARTASAVGYLYVIVGTFLTTQLLTSYFSNPNTSGGLLFAMSIIPTCALWRGLNAFSLAVAYGEEGVGFGNINDSPLYIGDVYGYFIGQWIILMLLFFYLDAVWVGGFGVKKKPLFFLEKSFWVQGELEHVTANATRAGDNEDVAAERAFVAGADNLALRTLDLKKVYPARGGNPEKLAVNELTLGMHPGECLGFLGPNGAGKSTTINVVSGLITPSSGTATVFGFDIRRDIDKVHSMMGVCAQDDILWEDLTGREHLLFYGRLKGLRGKELEDQVFEVLKSVNLHNEKGKRSGQYSGGMKRRLSVACAVIGRPHVVLLDEPSTGLDPKSRMDLWQVILSFKSHSAMMLTTHSMEEAEALCDRVAIFTDGELRTIGTANELKARHGKGYKLTISVDPRSDERPVHAFVLQNFPGATLLNTLAGNMNYEVPRGSVVLSRTFDLINANRERFAIKDWAIQNSTLEEVFLHIEEKYRKDSDGKNIVENNFTELSKMSMTPPLRSSPSPIPPPQSGKSSPPLIQKPLASSEFP